MQCLHLRTIVCTVFSNMNGRRLSLPVSVKMHEATSPFDTPCVDDPSVYVCTHAFLGVLFFHQCLCENTLDKLILAIPQDDQADCRSEIELRFVVHNPWLLVRDCMGQCLCW